MGAVDLGRAATLARASGAAFRVVRPSGADAESEVYVRVDYSTPDDAPTPVITVEAEIDEFTALTAVLEEAGYTFLRVARYLD